MTAANSDTELLTEHFGYPPVSLLDEIINSINFLAEKALASVEAGLLNAPPQQIGFGKPVSSSANSKSKRKRKQPDPQPPDDAAAAAALSLDEIAEQAHAEIASGTHQLETLLCTSIDRNFDKFELYVMRNILCVRPEDRDYMRLGHYAGLNFENLPPAQPPPPPQQADADKMDIDSSSSAAAAPSSDYPTVDSVNRLRRRLQASQRLNAMLHAEKARNDALLGELRAIVGRAGSTRPPLAFLHDRGDLTQADAATPLTTTTAFALSQMQALRALGTSLSHITPDLKTAAGGGGGEEEEEGRRTWRKERVEYVERAARRHLESVRGLELGKNGEVRDGEWQGDGIRFSGVEVGALEGVVGLLAPSRPLGDGDAGGGGAADDEMVEADHVEQGR